MTFDDSKVLVAHINKSNKTLIFIVFYCFTVFPKKKRLIEKALFRVIKKGLVSLRTGLDQIQTFIVGGILGKVFDKF